MRAAPPSNRPTINDNGTELIQAIALCRQAANQPVLAAFSGKLHAMLQTTTKPPLP
jgi:hypothetical protein